LLKSLGSLFTVHSSAAFLTLEVNEDSRPQVCLATHGVEVELGAESSPVRNTQLVLYAQVTLLLSNFPKSFHFLDPKECVPPQIATVQEKKNPYRTNSRVESESKEEAPIGSGPHYCQIKESHSVARCFLVGMIQSLPQSTRSKVPTSRRTWVEGRIMAVKPDSTATKALHIPLSR